MDQLKIRFQSLIFSELTNPGVGNPGPQGPLPCMFVIAAGIKKLKASTRCQRPLLDRFSALDTGVCTVMAGTNKCNNPPLTSGSYQAVTVGDSKLRKNQHFFLVTLSLMSECLQPSDQQAMVTFDTLPTFTSHNIFSCVWLTNLMCHH